MVKGRVGIIPTLLLLLAMLVVLTDGVAAGVPNVFPY